MKTGEFRSFNLLLDDRLRIGLLRYHDNIKNEDSKIMMMDDNDNLIKSIVAVIVIVMT